MGSVVKRESAKGTVWHIVMYINGKPKWKKVPPTYPGKRGAERYLVEQEAQKDMMAAGHSTFQQAAETWLSVTQGRVKPTSYDRYTQVYRTHLLPEYGPMKLTEIQPPQVQAFITEKCERLSVSTVRDAIAFVLRGMLELAVQHRLLPLNPVPKRLFYPKKRKKKRIGRALEAEQVQELLRNSDPAYFPVFCVGFFSGMRIGEIMAMRKQYLDLEARRYHVHETYTQKRTWQDAKTENSIGSVALSPYLCEMLTKHLAEVAQRQLQAGVWADETLIFPNDRGEPLLYGTIKHRLQLAARACSLGLVNPHDMRHTLASLMISTGVNIKTVSEQLRHGSVSITWDEYGHLYPKQENEAMDKIDELLVGRG
jgi:integrase